MARRIILAACLATLGCATAPAAPVVTPTRPIPTTVLAGQPVTVYPLTMITAEVALGWDSLLVPRRAALAMADSMVDRALTDRTPEVNWVLPAELRRAASRAPGLLPDPDQMGTAVLRRSFRQVPDPLRSQMRVLTGTAGDRYALVPASLLFFRDSVGGGRAELSLSLIDVRTAQIPWRTVARGTGTDPWTALQVALETLTPVMP